MPRQSSKGPKRTSPPDVYIGLLFVSLAALVTGCIFLWLALGKFGFKIMP